MKSVQLPEPPDERTGVVAWVVDHLAGLYEGPPDPSPSFRGGQTAADAALAGFDVTGYAGARNEVWPVARRGASRLSPYIRHGLLPLPRVWSSVGGGPSRDVGKFRDELLWQEYARHLYARLGSAMGRPLRFRFEGVTEGSDPWPEDMECVRTSTAELERDGWIVNQTRMWLASHWAVRNRADWRRGEDRFFAHLLDGSRAANRLGWQWTSGLATGKQYGFSRSQVERRAPDLCAECRLVDTCPIDGWPPPADAVRLDADPRVFGDVQVDVTAGPRSVERTDRPDAVWLTAESLGDEDPALAGNPELPAVFVFDDALLRRLRLSGKRLVFLTECLADLGRRRHVELHRGDPVEVLQHRRVAATFTPVPGWRRRAEQIAPAEVHPWPWLRRPHGGSLASFSAWRRGLNRDR